MIKEFEMFHGAVFTRLLHEANKEISIKPYSTPDNASYIINDDVGIYIKYSSKRMTPWKFSLLRRHQDELLEMQKKFRNVFLLLVCNTDGIVSLGFDDLKVILDHSHEAIEWVSVSRNKRGRYSVSGSDGKLKFKISRKDFPGKMLE